MKKYAWITLLATDNFLPGVIMLNNSLKKVNTEYPLYVIATNNLAQKTFDALEKENILYKVYPYISFFCDGNRNLDFWKDVVDQRENVWWNCTFSKIYMFLFTEFEKICFVDADVEFLKNCDNYFSYPTPAAFCYPYSDGMPGGTMVITPSEKDFFKCLQIGSKLGIVNDEMIWYEWYPNFKNEPDHILPSEDFNYENNVDNLNTAKLIHYDGQAKPWL